MRILLVGAGQIGSRYAEGMTKVKTRLEVFIVDPSETSLAKTAELIENQVNKNNHSFIFKTSQESLSLDFDLAIVATCARDRHQIVRRIHEHLQVNHWLLEKVLEQSPEYVNNINTTLKHEKAWVNCPRRYMKIYHHIREHILKTRSQPITMEIKGSSWGLACNSIHFIDLFNFLTSSPVSKCTNANLSNWTSSKRNSYLEANGILTFENNLKDSLIISCNETVSKEKSYIIRIFINNQLIEIDEIARIAQINHVTMIPPVYPRHSELTPLIINQIKNEGTCELTQLQESAQIHRIFLGSLIEQWNHSNSKKISSINIT